MIGLRRQDQPMDLPLTLRRFAPVLLLLAGLTAAANAGAGTILDQLESAMATSRSLRAAQPTTVPTAQEEPLRYTAAQIDAILDRADAAWKDYVHLRPQLRTADSRQQAYAQRARALRYRLRAVERVLENQEREPTRDGPKIVTAAMGSLDRATAAVEHDHDRIVLSMAQEQLLPPGQPFCLCLAPAFARIPPDGPLRCAPAVEASLTLAQGEAESLQIVVVPYWDPLRDVRVEVADFYRQKTLDQLGPGQIDLWLVETVASSSPLGLERLWPDPLAPLAPFDTPATCAQAILVDVRARKDQPPGMYEGKITVTARDMAAMAIDLRVRVHPFSLPGDVPDVALRVENDYLQSCFNTSQPLLIVPTWNRFLAPYGLSLFRPQDRASTSPAARMRWLARTSPPLEELPGDAPYAVTAPSTLAYRLAGWAAWHSAGREGQVSARWLVGGWVTPGPSTGRPPGPRVSPLVRTHRQRGALDNPPGLIYLTPACRPQPTLRLISLRDGIEDYRRLELLARRLREVRVAKKAGWWKRRKWRKLLDLNDRLLNPPLAAPDAGIDLLERRAAVAEAVEQILRRLGKTPPGR